VPKYFFALRLPDGEQDDFHGTVLPNDNEAKAYAGRVVRELKEGGGYDDPATEMIVKNETGRTLFRLCFGDDCRQESKSEGA
jgi:hypothetical protein